ncbi:hypothetical protein DFH09DRAFT_1103710 [Mycena vulgaris]|nr:hypothetical protein DFH09DRAFT_1103710 [Mycena vulgaris]
MPAGDVRMPGEELAAFVGGPACAYEGDAAPRPFLLAKEATAATKPSNVDGAVHQEKFLLPRLTTTISRACLGWRRRGLINSTGAGGRGAQRSPCSSSASRVPDEVWIRAGRSQDDVRFAVWTAENPSARGIIPLSPQMQFRAPPLPVGLLTRTVKDGYTASIIRHPYRPVGPFTPPLDGTDFAVPYTIRPSKIRPHTALKPYLRYMSKWPGIELRSTELGRNFQKAGYDDCKGSFVMPPTLRNRRDTRHRRH